MPAVVLGTVVAVRPVSPTFVTVTLSGCEGLETGGFDQRIKILLPRTGQDGPVLPASEDWYASYQAIPADERPIMRTFTIRAQRDDLIDIEFALHGDSGPASAWAGGAKPGSTLGIIGPARGDQAKALQYSPGDADWQLIVGDETALPAIASIVESLPADTTARVFVQIPDEGDARAVDTPDGVEFRWIVGGGLLDAVRAEPLPAGTPYAWIAGESGLVRELRRHLLDELGWERAGHYFGGYWRAGRSEDAG